MALCFQGGPVVSHNKWSINNTNTNTSTSTNTNTNNKNV